MTTATLSSALPTKSTKALVAKAGFWAKTFRGFLEIDQPDKDFILNVKVERARFKAAFNKVRRRAFIILVLVIVNIGAAPFLKPIHHHMAMNTERKTMPMVGLLEPNQTDQAILSWAATGITEIMTFGFGDFDSRILAQRSRFTKDGWTSFVDALLRQNLREGFKMRQLVLTTVPTDSPVIVAKGFAKNKEGLEDEESYRWIVEMPIIMTYLTNNNVSSARKGIVRLTIVRVPSKDNIAGIGIKTWQII